MTTMGGLTGGKYKAEVNEKAFEKLNKFLPRLRMPPHTSVHVYWNGLPDRPISLSVLGERPNVVFPHETAIVRLYEDVDAETVLHWNDEEMAHQVILVLRKFEEHEISEWVMLDGKPVIDPHPWLTELERRKTSKDHLLDIGVFLFFVFAVLIIAGMVGLAIKELLDLFF